MEIMNEHLLILIISGLIALAALLYNPAKTLGIPAALVFIIAGLFIGNGDFMHAYDYPEQTEFISQFALSIIIFTGGFNTPFNRIKPILTEGLILANFGVLATAFLFGYIVSLITPLSLIEGLLLGAIVSSTDAAATYSILESKKLKLKFNIDKTLEFESAANDPMAMILTLMFCMMLSGTDNYGTSYFIIYFAKQIIIGSAVAFAISMILKLLFKKINFKEQNLKPVFLLATLLVTTMLTELLGGNLLIASFIFGLMLANTDFKYKQTSQTFFSSISWLAQATMFVMLGLQIFPESLYNSLGYAWLPTIFLFLIARPVAVLLSYLPTKQPFAKRMFVSWVGIKGATPIVFALIPLTMGLKNAELIFNITVIVVISSMLLHGFSMAPMAKKLDLLEK